jgi:hypothetical protein
MYQHQHCACININIVHIAVFTTTGTVKLGAIDLPPTALSTSMMTGALMSIRCLLALLVAPAIVAEKVRPRKPISRQVAAKAGGRRSGW